MIMHFLVGETPAQTWQVTLSSHGLDLTVNRNYPPGVAEGSEPWRIIDKILNLNLE
jgi:hypothetical protein